MSDHLLLERLLAEKRRREQGDKIVNIFDEQVNKPLAHTIYNLLQKHYPGHFWTVEVELERGKVYIQLKHLDEGGYFIDPDKIVNDPSMKAVIEGGGHLLERYRLARGAVDHAELLEVVEKHGDPIYRKHEDAPE